MEYIQRKGKSREKERDLRDNKCKIYPVQRQNVRIKMKIPT